jgi:hypothetical protein
MTKPFWLTPRISIVADITSEREMMPFFLVSSVIDEGISPNRVRLVEAESALAVAQAMLDRPDAWADLIGYTRPVVLSHGQWGAQIGYHEKTLGEYLQDPGMTAERLLELIQLTHVDGDSYAQGRITPLRVEPLPSKGML